MNDKNICFNLSCRMSLYITHIFVRIILKLAFGRQKFKMPLVQIDSIFLRQMRKYIVCFIIFGLWVVLTEYDGKTHDTYCFSKCIRFFQWQSLFFLHFCIYFWSILFARITFSDCSRGIIQFNPIWTLSSCNRNSRHQEYPNANF